MNRKIIIVAVILLLITISPVNAVAQDFDLQVESALLIEADTGQVLYEKNADEELPPASITKIMTLLLAMEKLEEGAISLEDEVNISKYAESMGGSQIFLPANINVKFADLMKAVAIASANDACVAVGEAIGGSYSNFISLMNERAAELGMENTYFSNSTGLPAEGDHYSTARDIARMSREVVKYPRVLKWTSTWVDYLQLPEREVMLANTNKLINKYPGMDGLKTGHTQEAGYCLAATARRSDMRLISVILKADSQLERQELTVRLLDYGFNRFSKKEMAPAGQKIHNIPIPEGKQEFTTGELADDLPVIVQRGKEDSLETGVELKENLTAPVEKGAILGEKYVLQEGTRINSAPIIATEEIERAGLFTRLWRSFLKWLNSFLER